MTSSEFTYEEKLTAIRRELAMRRRVYPRMVDKGQMTQQLADTQIKVFEAIEQDYEKAAQTGRLI